MVEVRTSSLGGNLSDFLGVVDHIYRDDPAYVRPLDLEVRDRLNPKKNPAFEHVEAVAFTAHENGKCVGRITAQVDHGHLARHNDETGFWGFLDTVNDVAVAGALLEHAESWLRARGMKRASGPYSLSINEEVGCLVEGFEHPPVVMMPHHRAYQHQLVEAAGYSKTKDLFAWRYEVGKLNPRTLRGHEEIRALPEVTARMIDRRNLGRDVGLMLDIFNDAWSDNWGFVPMTPAESKKLADDFRLLFIPEITRIVFIEGEAAAVAVALPNVNELIADLKGKLLPAGFLKLFYRLKVIGPRSGRMVILGVRKKYRNVRKYAALSAYLYAEMNNSGREVGMTWGELGWTLEDNGPMNAAIKALGGKRYKTYRIYSKPID